MTADTEPRTRARVLEGFAVISGVTGVFLLVFVYAFEGMTMNLLIGGTLLIGAASMIVAVRAGIVGSTPIIEPSGSGEVQREQRDHVVGDSYGAVYFVCDGCGEQYQNIDSGQESCDGCGGSRFTSRVADM